MEQYIWKKIYISLQEDINTEMRYMYIERGLLYTECGYTRRESKLTRGEVLIRKMR